MTRAVDIHAERAYSANVNKRINVFLPEGTIALLDRVTTKGNRSRFIDAAVLRFVEAGGRESLREQLEEGYAAHAASDLAIASDWFPLDEEAWTRVAPLEAN